MLLLAVVMLLATPVKAGIGDWLANTNWDAKAKKYWVEAWASKNFHLLDNATEAMFWDASEGEKLVGVTSSFYEYRNFSFDFGLAKSTERDEDGFPILGANYKVGQKLAQYYWVRRAIAPIRKVAPLLRAATFGGWSGRDFDSGRWRYGYYAGFHQKFGAGK